MDEKREKYDRVYRSLLADAKGDVAMSEKIWMELCAQPDPEEAMALFNGILSAFALKGLDAWTGGRASRRLGWRTRWLDWSPDSPQRYAEMPSDDYLDQYPAQRCGARSTVCRPSSALGRSRLSTRTARRSDAATSLSSPGIIDGWVSTSPRSFAAALMSIAAVAARRTGDRIIVCEHHRTAPPDRPDESNVENALLSRPKSYRIGSAPRLAQLRKG